MAKLRIDKYLADMGYGSRSEIKNYIKKGLITINGVQVRSSNDKADTLLDQVYFGSEEVQYLIYDYFIMNKPMGVISASEDRNTKTVIDLITENKRRDLFPVGRLDKDTEGLLFITNDGLLAHNLLAPKKHVDKTYFFRTDSLLTAEHVSMVGEGIQVDEDFLALPGELTILKAAEDGSEATLTIHEGKFHQVKRMMEALGNQVIYLKRISMGPLSLPEELEPGMYRRLTKEEIESLKQS